MKHHHHPDFSNYFQEFIEQTSKVFFVYEVESRKIIFLNSSFEKVWKRSAESALANPAMVWETIHPEDKEYLVASYQSLLKGIKKSEIEFRILVEDGNIRWLSLTPLLRTDTPEKNLITGFIEDTTAQKENYALLEKFAAKKNSVLEILSHDLAGPLNNISGISALLADEIKAYHNQELEKMVDMISRTSERSIRLIREFVKQEFMASANASLVKRRVNIVKKVKESFDEYKYSEEHIAKRFHFTTSHGEIFIEVDDYKFIQVINNLVSNAIKFTHDEGTISIHIEERKQDVLFTIADNGIGIPAKYHDELFEKFTKARRKGIKGEPSTGLGMSIIKTIVDWHQGKIWFESREHEGTTFFIELPKQ